jgi:hypothetical protein
VAEEETKQPEKVQAAKSEKPAEKKPEAKAEEKPSGEAPQSPPQKKRKKISRMMMDEVEKELKTLTGKMGSYQSNFARHLLARKKELTESPAS